MLPGMCRIAPATIVRGTRTGMVSVGRIPMVGRIRVRDGSEYSITRYSIKTINTLFHDVFPAFVEP